MFIDRPLARARIREAFSVHPAVALTGPRQCGMTTLARAIAADAPEGSAFFDLESAVDRRRLEAPEQALAGLSGLVVIDEIQCEPALFETLRVLVDRPDNRAQFLVLGSASPSLVRGTSESLAGRVGLVDLSGFDLVETETESWRTLWLRGGFPRSFLAPHDRAASAVWRQSFVQTFLERDIPQLGITVPAETLRRFRTMLVHYHGLVWNAAEFARALGSNEGTARRYLDILTGAFMVRALPPGSQTSGNVRSSPPGFISGTAGSCTPSSHWRPAQRWLVTRRSGLPSRASRSSSLRVRSKPARSTSGRRTAVPSSTCSSRAAAGVTGSNASSPTLSARRAPCEWHWMISSWSISRHLAAPLRSARDARTPP